MKKELIQRIVFIICVIAATLNPMLETIEFIGYILLAGSIFYLFLGWSLPLIKNEKAYLEHELAGYVYATVFFANFFEVAGYPLGKYLVYLGDLLALGFMIYMIIKRKTVKQDMLVQSVILFLVSPVPMWV